MLNWNSAVGVQTISQQKNSIQVTHANIFTKICSTLWIWGYKLKKGAIIIYPTFWQNCSIL